MFIRKMTLGVAWNTACFGVPLFAVAGTLHWWRAWVFVCVVFVLSAATMFGVFWNRQDLLNERFKGMVQRGQPMADRVVVLFFLAGLSLLLILTPLDVFQYHWLPKPPLAISSLGLVLFVTGWWFVAMSLKANNFAIPVVRYQQERQHVVVDGGVYGIVRHPMYTGVMLLVVGMPLWLESYAAALWAIIPIAALVVRIFVEERLLRRELPGYEAYTQRVRYRLVPGVW